MQKIVIVVFMLHSFGGIVASVTRESLARTTPGQASLELSRLDRFRAADLLSIMDPGIVAGIISSRVMHAQTAAEILAYVEPSLVNKFLVPTVTTPGDAQNIRNILATMGVLPKRRPVIDQGRHLGNNQGGVIRDRRDSLGINGGDQGTGNRVECIAACTIRAIVSGQSCSYQVMRNCAQHCNAGAKSVSNQRGPCGTKGQSNQGGVCKGGAYTGGKK